MTSPLNRLLAALGGALVIATGIVALTVDKNSGGSTASASGAAARTDRIPIKSFKFMPANVEVKAGTTVTWVNDDNAAHTATADDSSFDTGGIDQGARKALVLKKPGTFAYHCAFHPYMKATITVK